MLAFTLSLDDVVIASFTTGPGSATLPIRIYSEVRLGVKPRDQRDLHHGDRADRGRDHAGVICLAAVAGARRERRAAVIKKMGAEEMAEPAEYVPPKVWTWNKESGGRFASINRPIAGPTHEKELPVGKHPLQLYSLATPNGVKVTVMLEELLALGHKGAEYDAWLIKIGRRPVRQRLRRGQSELEDSRADGPQRAKADPRVRVRRDPGASRGKIRRVAADGDRGARRMPVVAVLADGRRALSRRRLRPFLRLCADQDRIRHRPLRDGGEAPARRARPPPRRKRVPRRRRLHDRRHRGVALVRRRWPRACSMAPANSWPCTNTSTSIAGPT